MSQDCPWIIAKSAMSLDQKIATHTGESQWITGDESRRVVHALRGRVDAIVVGAQHRRARQPAAHGPPGGISAVATARTVLDEDQGQIAGDAPTCHDRRHVPDTLTFWSAPKPTWETANGCWTAAAKSSCASPATAARCRARSCPNWPARRLHERAHWVEGGGEVLGEPVGRRANRRSPRLQVAPRADRRTIVPNRHAGNWGRDVDRRFFVSGSKGGATRRRHSFERSRSTRRLIGEGR